MGEHEISLPGNYSGRTMCGFTDAKRGQGVSEVAKSGHWREVRMGED